MEYRSSCCGPGSTNEYNNTSQRTYLWFVIPQFSICPRPGVVLALKLYSCGAESRTDPEPEQTVPALPLLCFCVIFEITNFPIQYTINLFAEGGDCVCRANLRGTERWNGEAGAAVHYALPDRFGFGIMYTHHKWRIGGGSSRTFAGRYGRGRGIGEFMAASIVCVWGPPAKEQWRKMRSATE